MALDLTDYGPGGHNLTNNNSATEVTSGLPFSESTSAVQLTASSSQYLSSTSDMGIGGGTVTLECWIKPSSLPTSGNLMDIVEVHDATSHIFYAIRLRNIAGTPKVEWVRNVEPVVEETVLETVTLTTGQWYHLALVYTSGTGVVEGFRDGVSKGTYSGGASGTSGLTDGFAVGSAFGIRFFDGVVDEVRVWNVARTSTQINATMNTELLGTETGLVSYYPFESTFQSASTSPSASLSPSASQSPSASTSASESKSASASGSASNSQSESRSQSISASASLSPSASQSPSGSESPSESKSSSASQSPSASESKSTSPSVSPSVSPSSSVSKSQSPSSSPSMGYSLYSRGAYALLPSNDNDLTTLYTEPEEVKVSESDDIRVDQTGSLEHMVHQFKVFVGGNNTCEVNWEGQSSLAPTASTVYLQVYNQTTGTWETVASNSTSAVSTDFTLTKEFIDLTDYKLANLSSFRVYQLAI